MTKEEIIEGNKLIAEYMGLRIGEDSFEWRPGATMPLSEHHLLYHNNWSWLMPIVEKIWKTPIRTGKHGEYVSFCIDEEAIGWIFWENNISGDINQPQYWSSEKESNIERVWFSVVEFIKWYNSNTPNR